MWKNVAKGLWVGEYVNGSNPINTALVDMGNGDLMAISPGHTFTDADLDAAADLGPIKALVSPGAFHHLGLPMWKKRFPDAGIYGPASSVEHIAKQHADLEAVQTFDALRPLLSEEFELGEIEGCKHPDLFLCIERDGHKTWFSNEILTNAADYPSNILFKTVFWITGNAPGIQANTLTAWLIGANKPTVRAFYERKLTECPPTRLVPCHGDVTEAPDLGPKIGEVLARRF